MEYLVKNKHWDLVEDYNIDKLLYLLIDKPTKNNAFNSPIWLNNNRKYHRDYDLPAYVYLYSRGNVRICWFKHGKEYKQHNIFH